MARERNSERGRERARNRERESEREGERNRVWERHRFGDGESERENTRHRTRERVSRRKGVSDYERETERERGRSTYRHLHESPNGRAHYTRSKEKRRSRGHDINETVPNEIETNQRDTDYNHYEQPWIQVEGRRKARLQKSKGSLRQNVSHTQLTGEKHRALSWRNNKDITSFYFSNFPEYVNVTYLWNLFQEWGKVWEVFIPPSKNKQGQRYGFVRFKGVEDAVWLERQLDNKIYIQGKKLFVNKPKYQRGGKREVGWTGGEVVRVRKESMNPTEPKQPRFNNTISTSMKSYAEAVMHDHKKKEKEITTPLMGKNGPEASDVTVVIRTAKDKASWLDNLWVGRLKNRGMFEKAVDEVQEMVGMEVKVSYWGDDTIILHDMDVTKADKINLREQSKGDSTIYSIQKWTPEMKTEFRLIWIHIWGVPLEIWDAEHFQTLISPFGEIVEIDEETTERSRLDVARILIRTKEKPIFSQSMRAMVNDKEHHLFLREEIARPIGRRGCRSELQDLPPSPFTTVMEDSDEDSITCAPDGASSEYRRDGRRRRWTNAINLWCADSEVSSDGDASPLQRELPPDARLPHCVTRQEPLNGPLTEFLHGSGMEGRRLSSLGQKSLPIMEKDIAGLNVDDIVEGADLRVLQHSPEDITPALYPAVNTNSNSPNNMSHGLNNSYHSKGPEGEMQILGPNIKGPESYGLENTHNLKVYSRKKMGAGSKYLGHSKVAEPSSNGFKPPHLDTADSDLSHRVDDEAGGVHLADVDTPQLQTCLSPIPSSSFTTSLQEDEEAFHQDIARHLGLTFEDQISEDAVNSPAMMGRNNLAS
ncbi:hypothetical protein HKD37_10G029395 [Glycine soja]